MAYTAARHQGMIFCTHLYLRFVNFPFLVHLHPNCFGFLPFPTGSWFWPPPASTPCEPCVFWPWVHLSLCSLCMTVTKCLICPEQQTHDGESLCGLYDSSLPVLSLSQQWRLIGPDGLQNASECHKGPMCSSGWSPRRPPLLGPSHCGNVSCPNWRGRLCIRETNSWRTSIKDLWTAFLQKSEAIWFFFSFFNLNLFFKCLLGTNSKLLPVLMEKSWNLPSESVSGHLLYDDVSPPLDLWWFSTFSFSQGTLSVFLFSFLPSFLSQVNSVISSPLHSSCSHWWHVCTLSACL